MPVIQVRTLKMSAPNFGVRYLMFHVDEMSDSEALHEMLCQENPGDTYTVRFSLSK